MKISTGFDWHDKWFGVYDKLEEGVGTLYPKRAFHHVWICIVPCFPIHIWWEVKDV